MECSLVTMWGSELADQRDTSVEEVGSVPSSLFLVYLEEWQLKSVPDLTVNQS